MDRDNEKRSESFNIKRMVIRPMSWKRIGEYFTYGTFVGTGEKLKKTCLDFSEKAFENDEFKELLMGEKEYRIWGFHNSFAVYTETGCAYYEPTDIWNLLQYGIYELYKKTEDKKIINDFVEALEIMLNGEPYDVFTALQYLFCYTENTNIGVNDFKIGEEIFYKTGEKLKQFDYDDLVVTDIKRITRIILKDAGIDIGYNTEV